jgi:hypothetical protein
MKPLFTIHEGEFLVGDYINRKLGRKFDVWVPSKDSGVDLLVTRKRTRANPYAYRLSSRGVLISARISLGMLLQRVGFAWNSLRSARVWLTCGCL